MGRPAQTSRRDAARAAIDLIDEQGLAALTVSSLARRLGVKPPSLYNHFEDRADLLRTVGRELLLAADGSETIVAGDWRSLLEEQAIMVRRTMAAHPHAAPLLLEVSPRFAVPAVYEQWLSTLDAHGVPAESWMVIIEGLEGITYGSALALTAKERLGLPRFPPPSDAHPFLSVLERQASTPAFDDEVVFRASVRAFLAGVATRAGSD